MKKKIKNLMITISTCLIAILIITVIILFILSSIIYIMLFRQRFNPNPLLKYFDADDFSLTTEPVEVSDQEDKTILRGYIYHKGPGDKGVVVFCHGIGPGQIAYTTEINYFCEQNYTVIAIDDVGCNFSDGKHIRGMRCGVEAAILAVKYIKSQEKYKGMKIHLVGHSLGGYSALCASSEVDCDSVVSISAPLSPASALYCGTSGFINANIASVLRPFWYLIDFLNFGIKGNQNSAKYALKSQAKKILLIQGEFDTVVPLKYSAYYNLPENEKIKKFLAKDKYHNPYASVKAQKLLNELGERLTKSINSSDEENKKYFDSFDFVAATEEDKEVMKVISDFFCK